MDMNPDIEETNVYYRESYVPEYLAQSASYMFAFRDRLRSLMEVQDFTVVNLSEPYVLDTPDAPPAPGMCTVKVTAVVREFDAIIPMGE